MATLKTRTKILIVDDHPLFREGLTLRISSQPDLEVCGEAASEEDGLILVKQTCPDLVIVDIALKSGHGIDLIKQIRARHPKVKMLVVSGYDESLYADRSLRAGAMGYENKRETSERVIEAVRTVLDGQCYLSQKMTQLLVGKAVGRKDQGEGDPIQRLSDRELEVFRLIGEGETTGAIARQLHLSVHTIETHREKIRHKLCVKNSSELMRRAVQWVLENG